MIQLYPKGTTTYTTGGVVLHPQEASVTWQSTGRYDLNLVITREMAEGVTFDYGQIVRCPVPVQTVDQITMGTVSYWQIADDVQEVTLWSRIPTLRKVKYSQWEALRSLKVYEIDEKTTYLGKNYKMVSLDPGSSMNYNAPPDNYPEYWEPIPATTGQAGKVAATLHAGDMIMKTGDFNSRYMQAATAGGQQGYIEISKCVDMGTTEERTIPGFTIEEQSFMVNSIEKEENGHAIRIDAEHISYKLGRTILGECNVVNVNPATALMFITGAMKEDYPGELATNIRDGSITADWSWKNAQAAILDPKSGVLQGTGGQIIRNDYDVYLVTNPEGSAKYQVTYGVNLKTVKWTGDVSSMVTRIYPTAQREDGSTLLLPEEYIDTTRTVPFVRPEVVNTGLKIGEKVKNSDGTEVELTEDDVYTRMREQAQNRFSIDKCDRAEITLDLDWVHMPDTAEYAQYSALSNAAPMDWVRVVNGPMGITTVIQMTGYTFDAILGRYKKATFGDKKQTATVAGYSIQNGAVGKSALAAGSVTGQAIAAETITSREILANSITSDVIASRSIVTELLAVSSVTADEIAALSVTTEKLAAGSVTAGKIAAGTITADQIASGTITAVLLAADAVTADKLAANAVTAESIAAGAVTATSIAADAVTADKIAAGAVDADAIAAGAISAGKIDTTDLAAINATLGTASIAQAEIAAADIDYAQVKDLSASSAYFGQAVIQEGVANKLFIPRLSVAYAQIVNATISDLVIQASDGNYYELDVDLSGNVTATQITPTAEEIAQGHTAAGQTIYLGTEIVAEDLNTTNIYASHALMDQITASIINVDQLFAREATIAQINAMDLSSNTYIRSTVGDWVSGSTITQTVNSINTRISSLGYGTFYYSQTEPSHEGLVAGDVWIKPTDDNSWDDISQYTWQDLIDQGMTWDDVLGKYEMYCWTGARWKLLYNSMINTELQTQINQNAYAITLKADQTEVNTLSGQVTDFSATLEVQAQQISAAVSTVNAKTSTFVQHNDPTEDYEVHTGDTWVKGTANGRWQDVSAMTWGDAAEYAWGDLAGAKTYVWNGSEWVIVSDRSAEVSYKTLIEQTDRQITLLAQEQLALSDRIYTNQASIVIQADRITQEVERATSAEDGKIAKTTQYQTADAIVTEAVSQATTAADGTYLKMTSTYQTADSIVTAAVSQAASAAAGAYLAKTSTYQTAESIANEAIRLAGVNANAAYLAKSDTYQTVDDIIGAATALASSAATTARNASIAKTSTYQTAEGIVNLALAAVDMAPVFTSATSYPAGTIVIYGGKMYRFNAAHSGAWTGTDVTQIGVGTSYIAKTSTYQTADAIVATAESYTDNNAYSRVSGITITSSGIDISGSQYVRIASGGEFDVTSPGFGVASKGGSYVLWAGASTAASSPFRVTPDGIVTLTKLKVLNESGSETEVNLRTQGLWKLNYNTIKSTSSTGGYCTSMTLSNGTTVNFNSAAQVSVSSVTWNSGTGTITLTNDVTDSIVVHAKASNASGSPYPVTLTSAANKTGTASILVQSTGGLGTGTVSTDTVLLNVADVYDSGYSSGTGAGWTNAHNKYANSMSGTNLTISYPGSTYGSTAQQSFTVKGLSSYSRAGQIAYTYSGGSLVSFTIPSNTLVGNPYISTVV